MTIEPRASRWKFAKNQRRVRIENENKHIKRLFRPDLGCIDVDRSEKLFTSSNAKSELVSTSLAKFWCSGEQLVFFHLRFFFNSSSVRLRQLNLVLRKSRESSYLHLRCFGSYLWARIWNFSQDFGIWIGFSESLRVQISRFPTARSRLCRRLW